MRFFGGTDAGKVRETNEDSLLIDESIGLVIVADGIGGQQAGEVASRMAVETIHSIFLGKLKENISVRQAICAAMDKANEDIISTAEGDPFLYGMGTTAVLAACSEKEIHIANVGDSRAYIFKDRELKLVTEDHSLLYRQVKDGRITDTEAREHPYGHVLIRSLGSSSYLCPDITVVGWSEGDILLLCTDGLTDMADDLAIEEIMQQRISCEDKCSRLVELALTRGGLDNITVLLACNV